MSDLDNPGVCMACNFPTTRLVRYPSSIPGVAHWFCDSCASTDIGLYLNANSLPSALSIMTGMSYMSNQMFQRLEAQSVAIAALTLQVAAQSVAIAALTLQVAAQTRRSTNLKVVDDTSVLAAIANSYARRRADQSYEIEPPPVAMAGSLINELVRGIVGPVMQALATPLENHNAAHHKTRTAEASRATRMMLRLRQNKSHQIASFASEPAADPQTEIEFEHADV